jgi:hypothetical protein
MEFGPKPGRVLLELNPVECFWNSFKQIWKKEISGIRRVYDHRFMEADINEIMRLTVRQTRLSRLLDVADKFLIKIAQDQTV